MMTYILVGLLGTFIGALLYHFKNLKFILEYKLLQEKLILQDKYQQESAQNLELKLKNMTQQIFEEKTKSFREDSLKGMELMLNPFKDKMSEFSKKVEEIHLTDLRDRVKLHAEIERIALAGQQMSLETQNLTRALKGDVKVQGNWGEVILERILEASGLRVGEEYVAQGKDLKLRDDEGRTQMPDVIINLPDQKHLIVDSKVSLVAYERYINEQKEVDLKAFLDSLYAHIKNLSAKNYQGLSQVTTPDYVMLFIPIEGAFMLSLGHDKEILTYAWERNIVLVGPSTLLATLRTVASLWKQERQTKNALEIARQAGGLYDKFVGVVEDFDSIHSQIKRVGDSFESLRLKMLTGKGSVTSRMENLRELGAKNSKSLPINLDQQ